MAYEAPYIDENGLHIPDYEDILQRLLSRFRIIFGDDLYLGEDTQDYQMCAEFADLVDDIGAVIAQDYASRNPDLATGLSLDYLLPMNGLRRLTATYSTATVLASGAEGTQIPAGSYVMDTNGNQWVTDADAVIPASGSVSITVTAAELGHINAEPGSISQIMSPTAGWLTVTNPQAAVAGRNRETDAEVRARRVASVSNSGRASIEVITGNILSLAGVQKARVYENKTHSADSNGIEANSLCAVVLGGDTDEIAKTIFNKKAPGCGTFGTSTVSVSDIYGRVYSVKFSRPTNAPISVKITVKTFDGYSDETTETIRNNIKAYIESIQIGDSLSVGMLWACVLNANTDMTKPICTPTSITAKNGNGAYQSETVPVAYDAVMTCALSDITITLQ